MMKWIIASLKGWSSTLELFEKQLNMELSGYGLIDVVVLGQSLDTVTLENFSNPNDSVIPSIELLNWIVPIAH